MSQQQCADDVVALRGVELASVDAVVDAIIDRKRNEPFVPRRLGTFRAKDTINDSQLRALLCAKGADEQLIDYAADQLTSIYASLNQKEHYSFDIELPCDLSDSHRQAMEREISNGLEGIRQENHNLMLELVAQLVLTQVKLFQAQRD